MGFTAESPANMVAVMTVMFRNMVTKRGMSPESARQRLLQTEPFNNHPELVANLPDPSAAIE